MGYKVLSVKQPHAFLLATSIKDIENRTWPLPEKYKGETILIHASARWDDRHRNMSQLFTPEQWRSLSDNMQKIMVGGVLPTSAIIGSVRFVDCAINHPSIWAEKDIWLDKTTYNWVATDAILFPKPILNVKGKLSFWNFDLPEEYVKLINDYDEKI